MGHYVYTFVQLLPACLPTYLPAYQCTCLCTCQLTCLNTYLSTYLPAFLLACLLPYLPTCLPAWLPACLAVYRTVWENNNKRVTEAIAAVFKSYSKGHNFSPYTWCLSLTGKEKKSGRGTVGSGVGLFRYTWVVYLDAPPRLEVTETYLHLPENCFPHWWRHFWTPPEWSDWIIHCITSHESLFSAVLIMNLAVWCF